MAVFKAFKPEAMNKIAKAMGYSGDMGQFQSFIEQDPMRQQQMQRYTNAAMQMAKGGVVQFNTGGFALNPQNQIMYKGQVVNPQSTSVGSENVRALQFRYQGVDSDFNARDYTASFRVGSPGYAALTGLFEQKRKNEAAAKKAAEEAAKKAAQPPQPPQMGQMPNPLKPDLPAPVPNVTPEGPIGGGLSKQPYQQNFQSAPMYEQFKQSDYYKNMPKIGSMVTGGATIDGQTYNFPMAMEARAYKDYMTSLGGYQVGAERQPPGGEYYIDSGFRDIPESSPEFIGNPSGGIQPVTQPVGQPIPKGIYEQSPGFFPFKAFAAVEPPTGKKYAYTETGDRIIVDKDFSDYATMPQNAPQQGVPKSNYPQPQPPEGPIGGGFLTAAQQQQTTPPPAATPPAAQTEAPANVTQATIQRMYQPGLPAGGVTQAAMTPSEAGQYIDPRVGTLTGAVAVPTSMATTAGATPVQEQQAAQMQAATAAPAVDAALQATQAAQGTVDPRAQVTAAQQTASSVGNLQAAQGNATLIDNPVQRNIQAGELISGAAADAQTAAQFTEQVQAAEATPTAQATVQGQLASLTANFDAANPPAWAAGAMRSATQQMAARGLGASSLAGQAIVQATMEAALPIAQADASVFAQFQVQNLSNRQQRAMLAAQQRAQFMGQEFDQAFQARVANASKISDVANQNFTAEQQVQLENSRAANTMNLNNLSSRQALVIAEASALANMDLSNLNNRQQAAVQNAQSFLQMDMANLSNQQQTETLKAQQRIQSLFTDQAAENAARQFNATSQNQVDQFFANLNNQVSQFNAAQINAQGQFNAGQANTVERFNAELNNQRDQFNAQNQIAISQANAQWRRQIATADTAAINAANQVNAQAVLGISEQAYENLWQYFADTMEWAWTTADNEADRQAALAQAMISADAQRDVAKFKADYESSNAVGGFITDILSTGLMPGGFLR